MALESLSGRKLADIMPSLNEGVAALSPCRRLYLNQPSLEPILRRCALSAGATVIEGAEVTGVDQDTQGVTVTVTNVENGRQRELRGQFLIAADGGHSTGASTPGNPVRGARCFFQLAHDLFHGGPVALDRRPCLECHLRQQSDA